MFRVIVNLLGLYLVLLLSSQASAKDIEVEPSDFAYTSTSPAFSGEGKKPLVMGGGLPPCRSKRSGANNNSLFQNDMCRGMMAASKEEDRREMTRVCTSAFREDQDALAMIRANLLDGLKVRTRRTIHHRQDTKKVPGLSELIDELEADTNMALLLRQEDPDEAMFRSLAVYAFAKRFKPDDHFLNIIGGVYFDMSPSDITSETLHRATLRLFILPGPSDETVVQLVEVLISGARDAAPGPAAQFTGPDQVHLKIRSIHKAPASLVRNLPSGNNRTHLFEWVNAPAYDPVLLNVSKEALPLNSSGYWVEVDVTDLVANWISETTENHGLRLEAFDRKGLNHVFACDNPAQEPEDVKGLNRSSLRPVMEITKKTSVRIHRAIRKECEPERRLTACCRQTVTVDLDTFEGLDFIVFPRVFQAHYCAGYCSNGPRAELVGGPRPPKDTNTTAMQPSTPHYRTCCSPSARADMFVIYYNDKEDIVTGVLPDLIATRCACS